MTYHEADKVLKRIKRQISNGKRSPDDLRKELRALPDTQQQGRALLDGTCPFAVEARRLLNLTQ